MICVKCNGPMIQLFTSWACKDECEKKIHGSVDPDSPLGWKYYPTLTLRSLAQNWNLLCRDVDPCLAYPDKKRWQYAYDTLFSSIDDFVDFWKKQLHPAAEPMSQEQIAWFAQELKRLNHELP